ncbi:MAG: helix-turn-helix domain-containing protein [Sarcina sp.]
MLNSTKLNKLSKEKGLSLSQIERITGISNQYLSKLWTGKMTNPSVAKAKRIADVLEVKIDDLIK